MSLGLLIFHDTRWSVEDGETAWQTLCIYRCVADTLSRIHPDMTQRRLPDLALIENFWPPHLLNNWCALVPNKLATLSTRPRAPRYF